MRYLSIVAVALVLCASSLAQPLADRVPADALVYIGWRGTNDLGAGYAGSRMEAIAKESSFSKIVNELLPAAATLHQRKNPEIAKALLTAQGVVKPLMQYPSAVFFAGMTEDKKAAKLGFVCRAGAESDKVLAELEKLVAQSPKSMRAKAFAVGDVVAVTFGYAPDQMALAGGEGRPGALADDAAFKSALAKVDADPVVIAYANGKALMDFVATNAAAQTRDPNVAKSQALIEEIGYRNIGALVWTGTFKDRNWQESAFAELPAPRKGFVGLLEGKPFNQDLLARVPASATYVSAGRIDLAKGAGEVKRIAAAVDPQWGDIVSKAFGAAKMAVFGKDLQDDILEPLGDEWVVYNSPEIAGMDVQGMVLVNKLDDPAKAKQSIASLSIFLSNTAQTFTARQDFKLNVATMKIDDMTVYYTATPVVAPAWTIKDGYLYVGLFPQNVVAAAKYSGKSIKENVKFAQTVSRLEQSNLLTLRYDDVEAYLPSGYGMTQMLVRTGLGFSDMFLAPTPEMMLPPLPTLLANAGPAGSIVWTDDAGFHSRSVAPFPGATMVAEMSLLKLYTMSPTFIPMVALGGLVEARTQATRVSSASNLRQIGLAMKMHAMDNRMRYPADFDALLNAKYLTPDVFNSPEGDAPGGDYLYLYFNGLTDSSPAEVVVAFDKAAFDQGEGANVLFVDGHVEWLTIDGFWEAVERSRAIEPKSCPKDLLGR